MKLIYLLPFGVLSAVLAAGFLSFRSHSPKNRPDLTIRTSKNMDDAVFHQNSDSELMGKFDPASHPDFVAIPRDYTDGGQSYYLRKEAMAAFKLMHEAAKKEGINFFIISATRNFDRQKQIWESKWTGKTIVGGKNLAKAVTDPTERAYKILTYSSMPSTSRHHWGTDFDLNSLEPAYFSKGQGKKVYDWLVAHAAEYGYAQPYTAGRTSGYNEEKWHWSYTPLSRKYTQNYAKNIKNSEITGFLGSETAATIDMVNKYVLGVAETCK
ncbi:MAG: hypothetical protein RI894_1584 [Bacteroidota bacterium]|jgi:LAS superfamily LD-carboxypeptidase LdcB